MHELGVVFEVAKTVQKIAVEQRLETIETIVLQIGELSAMIPKYIVECYPAAVDGTILENTKLEIEIIPGNGICEKCRKVFNIIKSNKSCPNCSGNSFELLSGREFMIKEIVAC